ncbi:hypothetical protein D3C81_1212400 [compost metagenome]
MYSHRDACYTRCIYPGEIVPVTDWHTGLNGDLPSQMCQESTVRYVDNCYSWHYPKRIHNQLLPIIRHLDRNIPHRIVRAGPNDVDRYNVSAGFTYCRGYMTEAYECVIEFQSKNDAVKSHIVRPLPYPFMKTLHNYDILSA